MLAYASYAFANKEPNRDDYENGALSSTPPKAERLQDLELGLEENKFNYSWGINLYYMNYQDQLILTGKINDVGDALRINTPHSYRAGIELQGRYKANKNIQLSGNLTLSDNKIKNFNDYIPRYDAGFNLIQQDTFHYSKSSLAFSPAIIASGLLQVFPFPNAELNTSVKYTGRQFLDNSGGDAKSIDDYFVEDFTAQYSLHTRWIKEITIIGRLNNIWNRKYASNGYTYSYLYDKALVRENFYFPMAGRNFMLGLNVKF